MRTSPISMNADEVRKLVWFLFAAVAVVLLPSIFWNFAYDQGTFAYGGSAILRGEKPYLDFWDIKPPNIFYTYAIAFGVFGESVRAIRIVDYLNAIITIVLMYELAQRLWKNSRWAPAVGVLAVFAFTGAYRIQGAWNTAQAETFSVPFILAAALLVFEDGEKSWFATTGRIVLSGALLSVAFFFKFPNGIFLPVVGIHLAMQSGPINRMRNCLLLLGGFALGAGIEAAYLFASGELAELWRITWTSTAGYVSTNYSGAFSIVRNLRAAGEAIGWMVIAYAIILWVRALLIVRRDDGLRRRLFSNSILPLMGVVASLIAVQVQNKGYAYHYVILLPWAALLGASAVGVQRARVQLEQRQKWEDWLLSGMVLCAVALSWSGYLLPHGASR